MYSLDRLENHIIEMYKNGRIEISEFNSLKGLIDDLRYDMSEKSFQIDTLKSAIENLLDI